MACTSKNTFKAMLRRRYPNIQAWPLEGDAYLLSDMLSPYDNNIYNITPAADGRYVAIVPTPDGSSPTPPKNLVPFRPGGNGSTHTGGHSRNAYLAYLARQGVKNIKKRLSIGYDVLPKTVDGFTAEWTCSDEGLLHRTGGWTIYAILEPIDEAKVLYVPHFVAEGITYVAVTSATYISQKKLRESQIRYITPITEEFGIQVVLWKTNPNLEGTVQELYKQLWRSEYPDETPREFGLRDYDRKPTETIMMWLRRFHNTPAVGSDLPQGGVEPIQPQGEGGYTAEDYLKAFQ